MRLKGLVALVTGGAKGIGKAITLRLVREGADVLVCGRDAMAFAPLQKESTEVGGGTVYCMEADLVNPEDVARVGNEIARRWGYLDILVNNVGGVHQFAIFDQLTDDNCLQVFEDNYMTTWRMTQKALPFLLASRSASIVNICSVAGVQAGFFNCHYGSMKAAQLHLTKYLAANYGKKGLRFNAVSSTTIKDNGGAWERDVANKARMMDVTYEVAEATLEKEVMAKSVLDRIGTPEDVAAAVAYLVSDDARMITGSNFNVDGGTVRAI